MFFILVVLSGWSANIYETPAGDGLDWNNSATWTNGVPVGGNNYISTTNATYAVSGFGISTLGRVRDNDPSRGAANPNVFDGGTLTLIANTELLVKQTNGQSASANIIVDGGVIRCANDLGGGTNMFGGSISNAANSYLAIWENAGNDPNGTLLEAFDITASLSGSNTLTLVSGSGSLVGTLTNLTFLFSGNLSQFGGTLALGNANTSGEVLELNPTSTNMASASLSIDSDTTLQLDQTVAVKALTIFNKASNTANNVAPGVYGPSSLAALGLGGSFRGSGGLIVGNPNTPFTTSPVNLTGTNVTAGVTVLLLETLASGQGPFSYQWQSNGISVGTAVTTAATSNLLAVNTTGFAIGNYAYDVVVTNNQGSSTSALVTFSVVAPAPPMVSQVTTPGFVTVFAGGTPSFYAAFVGPQPISFQWRKTVDHTNYSNLTGATNTTLLLTNVQLTDAGYYSLWASNSATGGFTVSSGDAQLLVLSGSAPSTVTITNLVGLAATVRGDGSYVVTSTSPAWSFIGGLGVAPFNLATGSGADNEGIYSEITFSYTNATTQAAGIRLYASQPVVLFSETTLAATPNANFQFPILTNAPAVVGHVGYAGNFGVYTFSEFNLESPWLFFDSNFNSFIISAATNYMIASNAVSGDGLSCGINAAIPTLPAGFTHRSILVIQNGINHTFETWGKALTAFSGKIQPTSDSAVELNKLGYWTDNLTTYYYYYVGTYISTLLAVRDEFKTNGLALGYMQLDSWWYPKGVSDTWEGDATNNRGGINTYTADPTLFPSGLASFQQQLGLPMITHARWTDGASPYWSEYIMSGGVSIDPAYWAHIMGFIQNAGVVTYEQDWMNQMAVPNMNLTDPPAFVNNMAAAAAANGLNMQYCMPTPKIYLQSSLYTNLLTMRVSNDHLTSDKWDQFIYDSRLVSVMGAYPWTDAYNSVELRNLLVGTLSEGPVGVGDPLAGVSFGNLSLAVRADSVIVKPDASLVPTDQTYLNDALGSGLPMVASTYTDFSGLRAYYIFTYARSSTITNGSFVPSSLGATGEVYLYNYFAGTGAVVNASSACSFSASPANIYNGGSYFVIVPVGSSGIALLGDTNKFVTLGKKRIATLTDSGVLHATVAFGAGETNVWLSGYAPSMPYATVNNGSVSAANYASSSHWFTLSVPAGGGTSASVSLSLNASALLNLQIVRTNNSAPVLIWNGSGHLLESTNLKGPWTTNSSAASPFTDVSIPPTKFYRVKQ